MRKPVGVDLFAGAGGLSLGFEQAGFNIRLAIEADKHAAMTYKSNRKNKKVIVHSDDIHNLPPAKILKTLGYKPGQLDIVIGGPPCQGFSTSNTVTRNRENPKNLLIFTFFEYVKKLKPKWFVMENVAGLGIFERGDFKEKLLNKFSRQGYEVQCVVLNAANFGVPQSRNRIFFIGTNTGVSLKFVDSLVQKKSKSQITIKDAISDLPILRNGNSVEKKPYRKNGDLSSYQKLMRIKTNGMVSNNLTTRHSEIAIKRFKEIKKGENLVALAKRKPALVQNYKDISNCHSWVYLRQSWGKPSVAIINYRKNMLIHPSQNRGLSVREAARLQSFPDKYCFYGPLSYQQQQVANSVPPLFAKEVASSIVKCISQH